MQRESERMIEFAMEIGLDEASIERLAWSPEALSRFRAAWQRMRSLAQPKLRPIGGKKPGAQDKPLPVRTGGAIDSAKIARAREIFRQNGVAL
jgi:hypothetical protein